MMLSTCVISFASVSYGFISFGYVSSLALPEKKMDFGGNTLSMVRQLRPFNQQNVEIENKSPIGLYYDLRKQ